MATAAASAASAAHELLRAGDPAGALASLQAEVRAKPSDARLRVFLAQLLCVLGQWERALNQLDVAARMDAAALPMQQTYREAIACERLRRQVFEGRKVPMLFGEPEDWTALLIEALLREGRGEQADAQRLREQAFERAPAVSGRIDGEPFEWLADADMRLGPVLEAVINGKYYWVPFSRLSRLDLDPPEDLRDLVWAPMHLMFDNGGETVGLVPTRYVGTETSTDGQLLLARKTEWDEPSPGHFIGRGQRLLTASFGDKALLEARCIEWDERAPAPAGSPAQPEAGHE